MGYTLFFPTPLDQIDKYNDNIDVCMTLDNGRTLTFVIATPDNLKCQISQNHHPFITPGAPILIAEKLTEDVISQLMKELVKDEVLLQTYGADLLN